MGSETKNGARVRLHFRPVLLSEIFTLKAGEHHCAADLDAGNIPLVSCGDIDNGIMGFVCVSPETIHLNKLTIAFNGDTLATKYHPYKFAAKDDVAVCTPNSCLKISTLLFIQTMMRREKWRYSYYRKCFIDKLKRQTVTLPTRSGAIDEDAMQTMVETTPYWKFIKPRLE